MKSPCLSQPLSVFLFMALYVFLLHYLQADFYVCGAVEHGEFYDGGAVMAVYAFYMAF